jgi:two-component sensor histidine kinase
VSLGFRLILLILLAAVPVFVIQIFHDINLRKEQVGQITRNSETMAGLAAARLDRVVDGARLLLIASAHLQSIREKRPIECGQRLKEIASHAPELTALAVLSTEGDRWCVSIENSAPMNLRDRAYFQDTLRTGSMRASDFIVGRQTGEGSLVFTYPQMAGDRVESVVFAAYRTSVLSKLLSNLPLSPESFVLVVDKKGVVAARWPDPERWMGRDLSQAPVVQRAIKERVGALNATPEFTNKEYAFAFRPMQAPTELTVLAALPLSDALRETEAAFWKNVGLTTLVFALAILIALLGTRLTVTRPIRELQNFADELSKGNFLAPAPASKAESRELRELALHFQEMARSLQERQQQLMEAVQQKEILLKEVNHRVKNSLQLVASLFGLQRASIRDPEAKRQFQEAGRRINTVAQIHQRLYQDENVNEVALDRFLKDLCADLQNILGREGISLECQAAPCQLTTDKVIPVALIANELITNAYKYSYDEGSRGVIRVICEQEPGNIAVSVSDDGKPLPEGFDPTGNTGLGMKMILALTKQLRGELEIIRSSPGKIFVLKIPT